MQGAVFAGGGDYPGNPFIIGSGRGRAPLPHQERAAEARRAGPDHARIRRRLPALPRGADAHRHRRRADARGIASCTPPAPRRSPPARTAMRPGNTFGDVFDAHATVMDAHGMTRAPAERLRLFARRALRAVLDGLADVLSRQPGGRSRPDMVLFAHMILMDSDAGAAMCLGRTYLTTEGAPEPLSRHGDGDAGAVSSAVSPPRRQPACSRTLGRRHAAVVKLLCRC